MFIKPRRYYFYTGNLLLLLFILGNSCKPEYSKKPCQDPQAVYHYMDSADFQAFPAQMANILTLATDSDVIKMERSTTSDTGYIVIPTVYNDCPGNNVLLQYFSRSYARKKGAGTDSNGLSYPDTLQVRVLRAYVGADLKFAVNFSGINFERYTKDMVNPDLASFHAGSRTFSNVFIVPRVPDLGTVDKVYYTKNEGVVAIDADKKRWVIN